MPDVICYTDYKSPYAYLALDELFAREVRVGRPVRVGRDLGSCSRRRGRRAVASPVGVGEREVARRCARDLQAARVDRVVVATAQADQVVERVPPALRPWLDVVHLDPAR